MIADLISLFSQDVWWSHLLRIALVYLCAWIIHRISWRMAGRIVRWRPFVATGKYYKGERQRTLKGIIANMISFLAYVAATLIILADIIGTTNVIWMVGLFSAAFGLGARPVISDVLTGISFIFEDTFAVNEKVELQGIEGTVESVNLRTTSLRSPGGELYIIPNGEIRVIRNFSRGRFSLLEIKLHLAAADLSQAIPMLEALGEEAVQLLPNLLEPWQVISETGELGQHTALTLIAKAKFGKAANMRPRLLALVQERLTQEAIQLMD